MCKAIGSDVPGFIDMPQALQVRWEIEHNVRILCVHEYQGWDHRGLGFQVDACKHCGKVRR